MLRMYLVLMVTTCSGERSVKYKYIQNSLRTTMYHDRLRHLALMNTERDILRDIDAGRLRNKFARDNSRKCLVCVYWYYAFFFLFYQQLKVVFFTSTCTV